MTGELLQALVVPVSFVVAGLLGARLGTPGTVAAGVVSVGACHLVGISLGGLSGVAEGAWADVLHLLSQVTFAWGFVALVWVTRAFPLGKSPGRVETSLLAVTAVAALIGGLAGPTPRVTGTGESGPLLELLPASWAVVPNIALIGTALVAVATFARRFATAPESVRPMMRWPLFGVLTVGLLAAVGVSLGPAFPAVGSLVFLAAAPVLPLTLALGPVRRRLLSLMADNDQLNADLAARVVELEESRRRLSVAADEERHRIERDLHDGAQQELLALLAHVEIARSRSPTPELERAAELARSAYDTVRRISHGIRPAVLDDLGLVAAIRGVLERLPLEVHFVEKGVELRRFAPAVEAAALFFVTEALANVLKHSGARTVRVEVRGVEAQLRLSVEDDGRGGIDPHGAGVRGLCDRVEAVGGTVLIDTRPGRSRLTARFA